MKKSVIIFILSIAVVFTLSLWHVKSGTQLDMEIFLLYTIILIILIWGIYVGVSRIRSQMKGHPAEDEFSKKIMRKASSFSFYTSIFAWLILSFINDQFQFETHTVIGGGILLMVIIFVGYWTLFHFLGIKDE